MGLIKRGTIDPVVEMESICRRDCGDLLAQLGSADSVAQRRQAARELGGYPEATAHIAAQLKVETEAPVREVLFGSLIQLGNPMAIAGLVECLRSDDVALRNGAIEALAQVPEEVGTIMGELLADTSPGVRISAVNILESLRHPQVEAWLIQVIETDPDVNVCATAVDLLSEVGTTTARAPLTHLATRFVDEPYVQFAVKLALRRILEI